MVQNSDINLNKLPSCEISRLDSEVQTSKCDVGFIFSTMGDP